VYQNLGYLRDRDCELVLVLSGDHIYSLDYRELILAHLDRGDDLTLVLKRVAVRDRRFGYASLDADGNLTSFEEKPAQPQSDLAALTIYVFRMAALEDVLGGMKDQDSIEFGRDVIPAMLAKYRVGGYLFDGYWAYTRTVDSYYQAHEDLLRGVIDLDAWRLRTNNRDNTLVRQVPPIFRTWSEVANSLIGEGCLVDGCVKDSVLGPGVTVARGACVEGSILFNDVTVGEGAHIRGAIIDKRVRVGERATIGIREPHERPTPHRAVSERGLALIGKVARVAAGAEVPRWGIVAPHTTFERESA